MTVTKDKNKCLTITLNPSLDRTLTVNFLAIGYDNTVVDDTDLNPAGRGMNIARALDSLGVKSEAIVLLGDGPASKAYEVLAKERPNPIRFVRHEGTIRSNIFIADKGKGNHTALKEQGCKVSEEDVARFAKTMTQHINSADYVIFAGTLPPGMADETYSELIKDAQHAGAHVVVDTTGKILEHILPLKPDLIVTNQLQMEGYFNMAVRFEEDIVDCAHRLRKQGAQQVLAVLSDDNGAVLATENETLWVEFPAKHEIVTYTGTYDAMIAGYLAGRLQQQPFEKSLELGSAAALYTASQIGAQFGTATDIQEQLADITIVELPEEEK